MKVVATLRYARISPRKMRSVADVLRGLPAEEAIAQLRHGARRASGPLFKLVESAMANAEHNFSLDKSALRIAEIRVDGGPMLKRGRPRGFGRTGLIRHRTSHLTVVLEGEKKLAAPRAAEKAPEPAVMEDTKTTRTGPDSRRAAAARQVPSQKKAERPSLARRFFRRKSI